MIDIKVPEVGESITEVTIAKWVKQDGDYVEMDETIAELESDKATFELPAEKAGVLKIVKEEGADVNVGEVICQIDETAKAPAGKAKAGEPEKKKAEGPIDTHPEPQEGKKEIVSAKQAATSVTTELASPAAAKLMREHNIDQSKINGSGKAGRITKEDVLNLIDSGEEPAPEAKASPEPSKTSESAERKQFSREERTEKMSRLRQTIARRLVEVKNNTAMLTTLNDVDMSAIMEIRNKHKDKFKEKHGVGLGFMSFFTRACCIALNEWPAVNASIDEENIIYHDYCDISIAVSTPRGLVVPVIKNAESLSMAEIEKAVIDLATRARDNKLSLDEMQGGTFTLTNGGVFGSLLSTPIINGSQSAILGMHRIEDRPVAVNGQVVIKPMMYLALSYDHRIIDGRESVSFLKMVKELLENPASLYVQGDPVKKLLEL